MKTKEINVFFTESITYLHNRAVRLKLNNSSVVQYENMQIGRAKSYCSKMLVITKLTMSKIGL